MMNRVLVLMVVAFGIIAAASLAISIIGLTTAYAAEPGYQEYGVKAENFTTPTVSGYGEVSYSPDEAIIVFTALGYGETAAEALGRCAEKASAIISAMEELGISRDDLKTSSITVSPRYDWEQKPPKLVDYEASYSLTVRVRDITLVGKVIDAAFSAGADKMYGLQFTISEGKKSELLNEAIKAAIDDAMRKAEAAASSLGLKVVKVESISISAQQAPPIIIREVKAAAEYAEVPIAPGEGKLTASVGLTITLSS
ncbi:MAG: SIMPL domain-containing protein [Thaumarchaeota archaeon]|nr:SIMPL domain-containing protein [Nitrososphaerota archaeon]